MSESKTVLKLLCTGKAKSLQSFALNMTMVANFFETRRNGRALTTYFALGSEFVDDAITLARELGLTLERIDGAGGSETYHVLNRGLFPGWVER